MRPAALNENFKLALVWVILGVLVFDEEPVFDFSD